MHEARMCSEVPARMSSLACGLPFIFMYTSPKDGSLMLPNDKSLGPILELGDPAARRNRSERLEQAMGVALALMNADGVIVRAPASRSGQRIALHARSAGTAMLAA